MNKIEFKGSTPYIFLYIILFSLFSSCAIFKKKDKEIYIVELEPVVISEPGMFRGQDEKLFNLIHTRLDLTPDWDNRQLHGTAHITVSPHFYPQNVLILDAVEFDIIKLGLSTDTMDFELSYQYTDKQKLEIDLNAIYLKNDTLTIYVEYKTNTYNLSLETMAANRFRRGLYFVNPANESPYQPRQLWTQGQSVYASYWFPTIDAPNQRTTQEVYITVEPELQTLTNGVLQFSYENPDGTRTDYWLKEKPHAPYLFALIIGEYAIVHDRWKNIDIDYYVEPFYEEYARDIFGVTPEMISFYSELFGIDYPWSKYHQITVRNFTAGAMENTGAVVYFDRVQRTAKELKDFNYERIIAHELVHHWFGNLVTFRSWSNLALSESFASIGEHWWNEHKYEAAYTEYQLDRMLNIYLQEANRKQLAVVRDYYFHPSELFDRHSYQKGGRILHMLRHYLGDDAFFAGLNFYLNDRKYNSADLHHLRLAMEEISGRDLKWFFEQWFFQPGHPLLQIKSHFDAKKNEMQIFATQYQDFDRIPLYNLHTEIDFYFNGKSERHSIELSKVKDTLRFTLSSEPEYFVFDPEYVLLAQILEEKKSREWFSQFMNSNHYVSKSNAAQQIILQQNKFSADSMMMFINTWLEDPFERHRESALKSLDKIHIFSVGNWDYLNHKVMFMSVNDESPLVRTEAINYLMLQKDDKYLPLYEDAMRDESYMVIAAALNAISSLDTSKALEYSYQFEDSYNSGIIQIVARVYVNLANDDKSVFFEKQILSNGGRTKTNFIKNYTTYLQRQNISLLENALHFINSLAEPALQYNEYYDLIALNEMLEGLIKNLNDRISKLESSISEAKKINNTDQLDKLQLLTHNKKQLLANYRSLKRDVNGRLELMREVSSQ